MSEQYPFVSLSLDSGHEQAAIELKNGVILLMRDELLIGAEPMEYEVLAMQAYGTIEALEQIKSEKSKKYQIVVPLRTDESGKPNWYAHSTVIWDKAKDNVVAVNLHYALI